MPQLDLLTFFTQFFWSVLCLFTFYFFVNKFIIPELTRVLKYRSKAAAFSTSSDKLDGLSQQDTHGISGSLSNSSERSGSSALYQYACHSSARVLTQARERRDTFLSSVISGENVNTDLLSNKDESEKNSIKSSRDSKRSSAKNSKDSKSSNKKVR